MSRDLVSKALTVFCVPVSLFILLLPFSFLTGWNLAKALIYWFFISPFMAEYLPAVFSYSKNQLALPQLSRTGHSGQRKFPGNNLVLSIKRLLPD